MGLRGLRAAPRLDLAEKKAMTNVDAPPYDERVVAATATQGHPLFWNESKSVEWWQALFKDLNITHIWDITPGSGAAAAASCFLGINYEGVGMSDKHCQWLDNIMDSCIFAIVDMRRGSEEIGGVTDSEFVEPIRAYFQTIVDEGRRYVATPDEDDEDDEDNEDEDEED